MFQRRTSILMMLILLVAATLMLRTAELSLAHASSRHTPASAVTFSNDVAPIFFNKCAACHRPGEAAPMSLLTYKDARPWAKSIKEKVLNRTMPPWHADPAYGKFQNDRTLSRKEIDTIVAWVDQGAPEGATNQLPSAPRFTEGWRIGRPDVVLTMPVKFDVPADGVLDYKYFVVPTHFTEDRWVQAAEVRAGNRSVVHHVIVFVEHPRGDSKQGQIGEGDGRPSQDGEPESIAGLAPGQDPMILPDGVGIKIRAGSVLLLQMHYTPNGVAQSDQTSVGFIFNKKPVVKSAMGGAAINTTFAIPPGESNHEVKSSYAIDDDCHITSLMPHMHVRGKDFQCRLVYPDGGSRIILSVPRYDFNWQTRYEFAEPIPAPKGSRIDCIAHFDNSPANKANPDPAKLVRWGPQTWDEMMIGFIDFTLDHEQLPLPKQPLQEQRAQQAPKPKPAETLLRDALPAIEQVLDKYVQTIGGKAAILAPTSRVTKATFSVPAFSAEGTMTIYAKVPNKQLTESSSAMIGTSRTGFNGALAWEEEDGVIKDLTVYPRRDSDFYLPIKLRELFPRIEVKGRTTIGNREVYFLEAPRGGNPKRWYFDTETGLLLRTEVRTSEGTLVNREDYEDYRVIDGVKIAFTIRQIDEDGTEIIIKLSEVRHNVPIDDSKFEKPATKAPAPSKTSAVRQVTASPLANHR